MFQNLSIPRQRDRDLIEQDAVGLLRDAMAIQGLDALRADRTHAAHHEAGHCVLYFSLGRRIRSTTIHQRGDFWGGQTRAGHKWASGPTSDPAADLDEAAVMLAGPLSELVYARPLALAGGVDELALARRLIAGAAIKLDCDSETLVLLTTVRVLKLFREHEPALKEIARRLMRKPKLDGERATAILRAHASTGHASIGNSYRYGSL